MSAPISFGSGLNTGLTGAALQMARFNSVVSAINNFNFYNLITSVPATNAQAANQYNYLVGQLVAAGFTTADADEAAQAAVEAMFASYGNGTGLILSCQYASAAAIATLIGLLSMPACAGECPTAIVAAMAAALAPVSYGNQATASITMWNYLINAGLIG